MKNLKIRCLLIWFSFLLILVCLTSCGSRKVTTNTNKKENIVENLTTQKTVLELKENTNVKVANEIIETDESTVEKTIYVPVDATKPSYFINENGIKKELNNVTYTHEKTKFKINKKRNSKKELTAVKTVNEKVVKNDNTKIKTIEVLKNKNSTRISFNYWWLLLLILLFIMYLFYRYKDKIWWF